LILSYTEGKKRDAKVFPEGTLVNGGRIGRASNVASLKRYIWYQKEHHKRVTFQVEYRKFLKAYGIDYDEKYVWE